MDGRQTPACVCDRISFIRSRFNILVIKTSASAEIPVVNKLQRQSSVAQLMAGIGNNYLPILLSRTIHPSSILVALYNSLQSSVFQHLIQYI